MALFGDQGLCRRRSAQTGVRRDGLDGVIDWCFRGKLGTGNRNTVRCAGAAGADAGLLEHAFHAALKLGAAHREI